MFSQLENLKYKKNSKFYGYLAFNHLGQFCKSQELSICEWLENGVDPTIYNQHENFKKSIYFLQIALEIDPKCDYFLYYLTILLFRDDQKTLAVQIAKKFCENSLENPNGWRIFAKLLHKINGSDKSQEIEAWMFLIELDPASDESFLAILTFFKANLIETAKILSIIIDRMNTNLDEAEKKELWKLFLILVQKDSQTDISCSSWKLKLYSWKNRFWNPDKLKHQIETLERMTILYMCFSCLLCLGITPYTCQATKYLISFGNIGEVQFYSRQLKMEELLNNQIIIINKQDLESKNDEQFSDNSLDSSNQSVIDEDFVEDLFEPYSDQFIQDIRLDEDVIEEDDELRKRNYN